MSSQQDQRIDILKNILLDLHNGVAPEAVQAQFNQHFKGVSALEISLMEHQLMNAETGITFEDVMKLCNVHANLFKSSIDDINGVHSDLPGHPVRVFKDENLALQAALIRIQRLLDTLKQTDSTHIEAGLLKGFLHQVEILGQFDNHYTRKEKLFFPHMERYGHVAPPKVMWGVDDNIRDLYADFVGKAKSLPEIAIDDLQASFDRFQHEFKEMIFKEESILINILLEVLTEDDWLAIANESDAYGYTIISKPEAWIPERHDFQAVDLPETQSDVSLDNSQYITVNGGKLKVDFIPDGPTDGIQSRDQMIEFKNAGTLSLNQIELIMNHLPLEVTFVNKNDIFQYFNQVDAYEEMIFPRTPSQIGRHIELCHPPKIWNKVSALIEDLRHGRRESESLWFKMRGKFVFVTYRAVRDDEGIFQGILETVQDIQPFFELESDHNRTISELPKK